MAGSISANLIAARQHTPQDIVMPQIMMDQAGRGMQAGQNKNDRRDRAVQFLNIVAQRFALLWQFGFDGVGEEFLTVGASPGWRPCEKVEDGLPDGWHARLWRRSPDSFFSVPLL